MLFFTLMLAVSIGTTTPPVATETVVRDEPQVIVESIDEKITRYAQMYGVNAKRLRATLVCESNLNPKAYNPNDPSYGIGQFLKPTFYNYAREVGIKDPYIWDVDQQLQIASYMFSTGQARQWTCYRNLYL